MEAHQSGRYNLIIGDRFYLSIGFHLQITGRSADFTQVLRLLLCTPLCDVPENLLHLFLHTFRGDNSHSLPQSKDPCEELLTDRNENGNSEMSIILFHNHNVTTKSVPDSPIIRFRKTMVTVSGTPPNMLNVYRCSLPCPVLQMLPC